MFYTIFVVDVKFFNRKKLYSNKRLKYVFFFMFHVVWTLLIKMKQKRDVTNIFKEAICYSIWVCMNVSLCNDFGQLFYLLYIKICICKQKHRLCVLFYSMLYTYGLIYTVAYIYIYIYHTHTHTLYIYRPIHFLKQFSTNSYCLIYLHNFSPLSVYIIFHFLCINSRTIHYTYKT